MELGPGLFEFAKRQEAAKKQLESMRKRLHEMTNSNDSDKSLLASAILHLADHVNQNTDALTAIQNLLNQGRSIPKD